MINEGMFKELVENSDDIRIVTDQDSNIRYISSSITKVFGVEPITLLGENIRDFIGREKVENWRQRSLLQSFHEEISLMVNGRKAHFDVQISHLSKEKAGEGLALKLHDITTKKFQEQELIRSNEQLDQVIYKTTHDLKAPLRSAMGLVNLAEKAPLDEKDQYLGLIKKCLTRLDSFIEEMNHFFRNEKLALQCEKLNIAELLKEELDNLQTGYEGKKIDVKFDVDESCDFYSDSIRVKTIVTNILSNAIKYSDPEKNRPFINISVLVNSEICVIRITDNGIGIDQKYLEKIFDLFFRATTQAQGTGIGLFIVKDTIEKLKGKIEVKSSLGQGTTFFIQIPNQIHQPVGLGKKNTHRGAEFL